MDWFSTYTGNYFISYWDFFRVGNTLLYSNVEELIYEFNEIDGVVYLN